MNHAEHAAKTDELDRLLNDPEVALDPGRIWQLLADLSSRGSDVGWGALPHPTAPESPLRWHTGGGKMP